MYLMPKTSYQRFFRFARLPIIFQLRPTTLSRSSLTKPAHNTKIVLPCIDFKSNLQTKHARISWMISKDSLQSLWSKIWDKEHVELPSRIILKSISELKSLWSSVAKIMVAS